MTDNNFLVVLATILTLCIFTIGFMMKVAIPKEITTEELYRFCMIKSIPLEECLIPEKPYKGKQ